MGWFSKKIVVRQNVMAEADVALNDCCFVGECRFGLKTYANSSVFRMATVGRFCSIGRRCSIGAARHEIENFTSHPSLHAFVTPRTTIGNDVWIGDGVVILAGLTIGDGASVGANAVVTKDVAPYSIVAGVPAKVIRSRFGSDIVQALLSSRWWLHGQAALDLAGRGATPERMLGLIKGLPTVAPHHQPFIEP